MISIYTYGVCRNKSIILGLYVTSNNDGIYKETIHIGCENPSPSLSAFHCFNQAISYMTKESQDNYFTLFIPDSIILFALEGDPALDLLTFGQKVIRRNQLLKNNYIYSIEYASPKYNEFMNFARELVSEKDSNCGLKRQTYFGKTIGKTKADSYRKRYYNV
jgi:hypothetical protein